MFPIHRRRILALGLGSTLVVGLAGIGSTLIGRPVVSRGVLSSGPSAVFRALATTILEGSLEASEPGRTRQIDAHLAQLAALIAGLPPHVRRELAGLLNLLSTSAGRLLLTGLRADWPEATTESLTEALQMMRTSGNTIRQQTYHALRDLTNAAFYSSPDAWPSMGYPGPASL